MKFSDSLVKMGKVYKNSVNSEDFLPGIVGGKVMSAAAIIKLKARRKRENEQV